MKRCPQCDRVEADDALTFCRADGTPLMRESGAAGEGAGTLRFSPQSADTTETHILPTGEHLNNPAAPTTVLDARLPSGDTRELGKQKTRRGVVIAAVMVTAVALAASAYFYLSRNKNDKAIESIAVMPFVNESGNADTEYLSDGMTETLISSLSQIPKLNVKARSSVFRYKGKEMDAQTVGKELNVQAILNGRVIQRSDDLVLYLELVDAQSGNRIWGDQYNKKLANLISLQTEIARDVSDKLRVRLSGADEQRLAKNYTENAGAYQLYLKGRYHAFKLTPPEIEKGVGFYRQAIDIDPNYALAYAGIGDAYRTLPITSDVPPKDAFPKAKAAAHKALQISDQLAEAHIVLGWVGFWFDWDWSAAESELKRAIELSPNNADAHRAYAQLLSSSGRHEEAVAEGRHARELDPLTLVTNRLEAQFLFYAGRETEAIDRLQKTLELDPNFWTTHLGLAQIYIHQQRYDEALAALGKARELGGNTLVTALTGYALAMSGRRAEAQTALNELKKLSTQKYVPSHNIAMIYSGLNEKDETFVWLEKAYEERGVHLSYLKVDPLWDKFRSDPRFQDLLRRVGLPQ
ncbi:MAG TPA: tetratricopeptide repeat protein [Pyrinomonadaceae bacterium]|nr:tetratricopeptide repeat protein [Pyrinomonadaceae bacterium]